MIGRGLDHRFHPDGLEGFQDQFFHTPLQPPAAEVLADRQTGLRPHTAVAQMRASTVIEHFHPPATLPAKDQSLQQCPSFARRTGSR